jgi:tripartite-type tricarboxylate transporter receptor subunit TctC
MQGDRLGAPGATALRLAAACGVATAALLAPLAHAQGDAAAAYPQQTVRIIVPFVAGGPTDAQARWAAQQLTTALGQAFIVENRAAAGGAPATAYVAKSAPDGYTLLAANPGPVTVAPTLRPDVGYTLKDLAPIILIAKTPSCLAVRSSLAPRDFQQFVALAKASPGALNYGTPGVGTVGHLTTELIANRAGIRLNHVPYRGAAQVTTDLVGGQIDLSVMQVGTCAPLVRQGKVRALAVTSAQRSPLLPDVPTMAESGFSEFDTANWNGLLAPAGTPPAIVRKIRDAVARQLATPQAREWLIEQGYEPATESLEGFGSFLAAETQRWGRIVKSAGIKAE